MVYDVNLKADSYSAAKGILHFYEACRFCTIFTKAQHWSVTSASCIQLTPSQLPSVGYNLILSSHLHPALPSVLYVDVLQQYFFRFVCHLVTHNT